MMKNINPNPSLYDMLAAYGQSDVYPFHMPGHKRQLTNFGDPWQMDLTEIDGFDNLHHATGILHRLQQQMAAFFGSRQSFLLVNGSTCGLLAAVSACVPSGGKLLMSRSCHKSVYHALELGQISPVYLMPEICSCGIMGSLQPAAVEQALNNDKEISAVLVVSPTYDGVVSDIAAISALAHERGIPLIVDEAHGAHFPVSHHFSRSSHFPASAIQCGADLVVESLHKTLPAFTQTAVLHLNSELVFEEKIHHFLDIYQTSSPSYLLMASADCCLKLLEQEGAWRFEALQNHLEAFYQEVSELSCIECFRPRDVFAWDDSKILLSGRRLGLSGPQLSGLLRERYGLELEMAAGHYALALCSLMDTKEGFLRLSRALREIDHQLYPVETQHRPCMAPTETRQYPCPAPADIPGGYPLNPSAISADMIDNSDIYGLPRQMLTISQAMRHPARSIPLTEAAGCVSQEYLYLYPPGIPLLVPGEQIGARQLAGILELQAQGLELNGLSDMTNQRINIVNF